MATPTSLYQERARGRGRRRIAGMVAMKKISKGQEINCLKCKNYYITYDPRQPRGCRAYGFKSQAMPSLVVLSTSGMSCQFFTAHPAS